MHVHVYARVCVSLTYIAIVRPFSCTGPYCMFVLINCYGKLVAKFDYHFGLKIRIGQEMCLPL